MRNRAQNVWTWTIEELALILLRQFKRLLTERGADRSDAALKSIASDAAAGHVDDSAVTAALRQVVDESEAVLGAWGMTFAQSLATGMEEMPGWESTADFLTLANDKVNAELRIAAGSALLALLGDMRYVHHALAVIDHGKDDPEDVDAVIATRALARAGRIDEGAADAIARIRAWVEHHS
jgi:hypothetical protein